MILSANSGDSPASLHPSCWVKLVQVYNMWCSMETVGGVKAQRIQPYIIHKVFSFFFFLQQRPSSVLKIENLTIGMAISELISGRACCKLSRKIGWRCSDVPRRFTERKVRPKQPVSNLCSCLCLYRQKRPLNVLFRVESFASFKK